MGGTGLGHALVAYAVGVDDKGNPDPDYYSVLDPITPCGLRNETFGSRKIVAVGFRKEPQGRAECKDVEKHCSGQ